MTSISPLNADRCIPKKLEQHFFPMTRLASEKFSCRAEPLSGFERVASKIYEYSIKIFAFLIDLSIALPCLLIYSFSECSSFIRNLFPTAKVETKPKIKKEPLPKEIPKIGDLPPEPVLKTFSPVSDTPPLEPEEKIPFNTAPELPAKPEKEESHLEPQLPVTEATDQPFTPLLPSAPFLPPPGTEKYPSDSPFLFDILLEYLNSSIVDEGRQIEMVGDMIDEMPGSIHSFSKLALENCLRMNHFTEGYLPRCLRERLYKESSFRDLYHLYRSLSPTERQLVRQSIYNPESTIDSATAKKVVKEICALASCLIQDREYLNAFHAFRQMII